MRTHPSPNSTAGLLEHPDDHTYCLRVFSADTLPPCPADVLALTDRALATDGDVAVARFERALRGMLPGHRAGRGAWTAPAEHLLRSIRLHLAEEEVDDWLPDIERLARGLGLGLLDERLGDVSFPTRLSCRDDVLTAAQTLAMAGDGYLAVEGGPEDLYYVHAIGCRAKGEITVEAVGNPFLPAELRLPRRKLAELRTAGWRRSRGRQGNYRRSVSLAGDASPSLITRLICDTLAGIYGLDPDGRITVCLALD